ncbi:Putative ankyrin repeat protein [Auxenochlorella protothecoides]|uniref:Putative ankyrin repeat protein n=1 Tax=Auxenochlorella protothecoides TaxID=3075 RepID=A0A087SE72_AUXPR|nr:Putative ankyrin repeat protein [Auxenochlorella protothecoides]KFM24026.1 Putative ankyrin repeat protein [Auxenochlorella protothecoides]
MRTFALLLVLSLALGSSPAVHAARPKFLQPEFYGSIARQLITQLEVDYGLTPEQAEVVQALYGDVTAPEAEEAIQGDFASGALDLTKSEATEAAPAQESLNVLNSLLFAKAGDGDVPAVEDLLDVQADPNAAADGQTPLLAALVLGNTGLAGVLISRGADTNRPGPDGKTPLLVAIANSSVASAEELLDNGADANLADSEGVTPLLAALEGGEADIVRSLIDHGADVNLAGPEGVSPFQWVLSQDPIDAAWVSEFISAGADVNAPTAEGAHPLDLAGDNADVTATLIFAGAIPPPEVEAR